MNSKNESILNSHYVIISAHQPENDAETNARLQASLLSDLLNLVGFDTLVIPCTGRYNGVEEESFAVLMPDILEDEDLWIEIQEGLITLGEKFNQVCLLVVNGEQDPPTAALFPLERGIKMGYTDYIEHPWIEVHDDYIIDNSIGITRILGKVYVIDEDNDVTDPTLKAIDSLLTEFPELTRIIDRMLRSM